MVLLDNIRVTNLINLAHDHFDGSLKPAELKVISDSAASADSAERDIKAPRPEVRSEFVRWLATDPGAAANIDAKELRVWGAALSGKLDFEECHILPTLYIHRCTLNSGIDLRQAEAKEST